MQATKQGDPVPIGRRPRPGLLPIMLDEAPEVVFTWSKDTSRPSIGPVAVEPPAAGESDVDDADPAPDDADAEPAGTERRQDPAAPTPPPEPSAHAADAPAIVGRERSRSAPTRRRNRALGTLALVATMAALACMLLQNTDGPSTTSWRRRRARTGWGHGA